ncbi:MULTISPECIES: DUF4139 domain-containing protein [unclassified Caulobacter]|uniref:DUF4139 domain-containing protein n=1 Tax=unclassified Caulobacter TaxID=2648921 RepID=UPI0006FD70C2|nr:MULTISPECIES: DUF4139 domain-containing protein [unclassified Caulobacter]KQV58630.1 hypothetical protein ASC62_07540 [Caulobacter sp. Root342]KQV68861.1 hypothetical protein ASC70_08495 [Caulobacter sp. Root343]
MNRRALLATAGLLLAPLHAAHAQEREVSVTIYNSDLALVEDARSLDLKAGRQRLEFKDVSAAIRPETVSLSAPGVTILEQNFDYDLLTPDKLMEKAVGQQVRIVRTNPGDGKETTEVATVLAANEGVVLKIGDRIEVLRDDGVPTRVIFDKVPETLRARPTLSVSVDAASAGPRQAKLSYLTSGLSWKADYVALFDEAKNALDLQGWITLSNNSGTPFENAKTQLVAGDVNQLNQNNGYRPPRRQGGSGMISAGTESGTGERIADYYVYPLAERTTIASNQNKQVGFLSAQAVAAKKVYEIREGWFSSDAEPVKAVVAIQFSNARLAGLGSQLPAGTMRVYMRDTAGDPKFVGENAIGHTPAGSELSIKTGEAFDVSSQATLVAETKVSKTRSRYEMRYLLRNARDQPVTVELRQGGLWRDGEVKAESLKSRRIDARTLGWSVPVPANGETVLTFTVETGW